MEDDLRSHLLTLSRVFMDATGASRSALSKSIFNDNTFFTRIETRKNFTVRSFDKAVQWFSDNWPKKVEWPKEVQRPCMSKSEAA